MKNRANIKVIIANKTGISMNKPVIKSRINISRMAVIKKNINQ